MTRLLALCMTLMLVGGGCNIFETREPEPPSRDNTTRSTFSDPVTPDLVLTNLRFAITERNPQNYLKCFIDTTVRSYVFTPSPDVRGNFIGWSLEDEFRYFQTLMTPLTANPFLTDSLQSGSFFSDSTYTLSYSLFVPHSDNNAPRLVRGNMQLHLSVDRLGRWGIDAWQDFKNPNTSDSTWSYLKFWFNK